MRKKVLMMFAVSAALACIGTDATAQRKSHKNQLILDGSVVNVNRSARTSPVEEKLKKQNTPGIEYAPTKTIYLYPKGQNEDQGIVENGRAVTEGPKTSNCLEGSETAMGWGFLGNVTDSARIDIFMPKNPNGQMVIACPGGGYAGLSCWNEGTYAAKWLNDKNIACAVLKYRLPNGHREVPLQDVHNAFRYCRQHSEEWGIRQIGVMGFSAGGHLASTAETMYADSTTRPDFAVLLYPVIIMDEKATHQGSIDNLIGSEESWTKREDKNFGQWYNGLNEYDSLKRMYTTYRDVTPTTPPTFIGVSTYDKTVPVISSIKFYQALVRNKVSSELHVYPKGGHGWGFTDLGIGLDPKVCKDNLGSCRAEFSDALERWLGQQLASLDGKKEAPKGGSEKFPLTPDKVVYLYPEGQNVDKGIEGVTLGPGESNGINKPEQDNGRELKFTGDSARFELYMAKNPNGKMVIICPGGSYWVTAYTQEGRYAAEWLNSQGISAAVVHYRLPYGHWNVPLTDIQNVFRYCRHYAEEWGVKQIGVMGFSAGGHLAATVSTQYVDDVTKPDFSVLVYPVISSEPGIGHEGSFNNLIGTYGRWNGRKGKDFETWTADKKIYASLLERYSLDKQVSADTPKTFIVFSSNDYGVPPENEIRYFNALVSSGVPCEMHAFPGGVHGYGFSNLKYRDDPLYEYRADFLAAMARFLKEL
jgi:acetyl esterase/lipase